MTKSIKKRIIALSAIGVAAVGMAYTNSNYFEMAKNIEIYANVYKELNTHYVDDIDPAKLMRIGIDAMTNSLDPFTNYISEADIEGYRIQSTGKYGGVGFRTDVHEGGQIVIVETYTGSPAEKVGLKPGDVIVKVDGKAVKGKNDEELNDILKGSPGTKVSLTLHRAGDSTKTETIEVTREEIKIPSVPYSGMLNDNIGYITLTTFTEDASENVIKALRELKTKNQLKGLVFDLRDNGGGLLTEAVNVVNAFEPKDVSVVDMRSKVKEWDKNFKTLNAAVDADIPLTILVNSHSASASEIVSGALQDLDRGVVIGQKSYGKGLVQNTKEVGYGSRIKLTTAKYYIPSGRCIQSVVYKNGEPVEIADSLKNAFKTKNGRTVYDGGGIIPDVKVKSADNSAVVKALQSKHKFFDFATQYCLKNEKPSAATAKEFRIKDADFEAFLQFLQKQNFQYETETEVLLKKIDEKAKAENMLTALQGDFTALRAKIATEKKNDLMKNKAAIMGLLEKEIVGRYFGQKGKIEHGLAIDEEVKQAISLLQDAPKMKQILGGK
jgi:carboxyl-terminal processing protease